MAKQCYNCKTSNPDNAHYCGSCGKPLEKPYNWSSSFVEYTVVDKSRYNSLVSSEKRLKAENTRLKKQIDNTLWNKTKRLWNNTIGDNSLKETLENIVTAIIVIVGFGGLILATIDYCSNKSGIEITEDNGKYGLYNHDSDTQTVPCECDSIVHFTDHGDCYFLYKGSRVGLANAAGTKTIDCTLDSLRNISYGLLHTFGGGKQGLASKQGDVILECKYHRVLWDDTPQQYYSFNNAGRYVGYIIPVKEEVGSPWKLYNRKGKVITDKTYKHVSQSGAYSLVRVSELYSTFPIGLVDSTGAVVLPMKFQSSQLSTFQNERAWKFDNPTWSCIDEQGKTIFSLERGKHPSYSYCDSLCSVLTSTDYLEYYDRDGKIVIPQKYKQAKSNGYTYKGYFYDGRAIVSYNGKNGYIDKNGTFTEQEPE